MRYLWAAFVVLAAACPAFSLTYRYDGAVEVILPGNPLAGLHVDDRYQGALTFVPEDFATNDPHIIFDAQIGPYHFHTRKPAPFGSTWNEVQGFGLDELYAQDLPVGITGPQGDLGLVPLDLMFGAPSGTFTSGSFNFDKLPKFSHNHARFGGVGGGDEWFWTSVDVPAPEPASAGLVGMGLAWIVFRRRAGPES